MENFGEIADFSHYLLAVKLPFLDLCGIPENTKIEDTSFPYQKPMLRQIKWWVQNGPITKNGVLPVTTFFF